MVDGDLAAIIGLTGCYPCVLHGIFPELLFSPPTFFILITKLVCLIPDKMVYQNANDLSE